jgi:hypothetical protein
VIGDTAYGTAEMLGWMVDEKAIEPNVPVWDKAERKDGSLGRSDFRWEAEADEYRCPQDKPLRSTGKPECARRGMDQVKANRAITVTSEAQRKSTPLDANSNAITEGQSDGWTLIYCKGPEGEQLEFVKALGLVKRTFEDARATHFRHR